MRRPLLLLTVLALVLSIGVAGSTLAKPAGGNNSANAKACQKGGYATLARSTDATTAFTTEKACTSYAATGGLLVAYTPPTPTPTPVPPTATPVPLSAGCTLLLEEPSLDTFYGGGIVRDTYFAAGETISLTARLPAATPNAEILLRVNGVRVVGSSTSPGQMTYTFLSNQTVDLLEWELTLSAGNTDWTVSCGRAA